MKRFPLLPLLALLAVSPALAQTTLPPEELRAPTEVSVILFAWQDGRFQPVRIGPSLKVSTVGGLSYLDVSAPPILPQVSTFVCFSPGQTVFNIGFPGPFAQAWVYRNGVLQAGELPPGPPNPDYTISSDWRTVTFARPCAARDIIQVFNLRSP